VDLRTNCNAVLKELGRKNLNWIVEIINYKLRILREHIRDYNSGHENPAFGAMANSQEQNFRFQQGKLGLFALLLKSTVRFVNRALKTTAQERGRRSGLRRKPAQRWQRWLSAAAGGGCCCCRGLRCGGCWRLAVGSLLLAVVEI
jgi:hypothetical protein